MKSISFYLFNNKMEFMVIKKGKMKINKKKRNKNKNKYAIKER